MNQQIKVLIVDDEQIIREGLRLTIDWEKRTKKKDNL